MHTHTHPYTPVSFKLSNGDTVTILRLENSPFFAIKFDQVKTPESLDCPWTDFNTAKKAIEDHIATIGLSIIPTLSVTNAKERLYV